MMSQSRDKKRDNKLTTPPSLGRNILGGGSIVFLWDESKSVGDESLIPPSSLEFASLLLTVRWTKV